MALQLGICSYSFHRTLEAGKQDMFKYIDDCKALGATQYDPWNGHFTGLRDGDEVKKSGQFEITPQEEEYLNRVKTSAAKAGLRCGCIAVDGAHMYEATSEAVEANRKLRYRWLEIARRLGASELRVDAGGTPDMPEEQFQVIVREYRDIVEKGKKAGIPIVMENHWGSSNIPENVVKIMEAVPGLGLLFDTNNWAKGTQERGWELCAKYAKVTHIKTFQFDAEGNDPSVNLSKAMKILVGTGYRGCFTVESCPKDGDEYGAVGKTFDLIRRELTKLNYS